jgi:alkanesulfonate monooxygenase SsuD/methylene tetrahydromethanopterin reductase-like flavin-dependent oxidoreductase (luciferase family)
LERLARNDSAPDHPAMTLRPYLRFDMRAPAFGTPGPELYRAAIDMAAYADRNGFYGVMLSEHHASEDGYLPSPVTMMAAIAGRTQRLKLAFRALIAPLYDPIRLAEDLAVIDQISGGRVVAALAAGFIPAEFAMFGQDIKRRATLTEEAVLALKAAWTGELFAFRGRTVRVTPRPVQRPHPPVLLGGSSRAAAERAARIADGFQTHVAELYQIYFDSAKALGKNPAPFARVSASFVLVAEDTAAAWKAIAPHALHEMNAYGRWHQAAGYEGGYKVVDSIEALKATGAYAVVTPEECVRLARSVDEIIFHPLMGGMSPQLGMRSLELFVEKVRPALAQ